MNNITDVQVTVTLSITDETVDKCLQILNIWLKDNPDKSIQGGTRLPDGTLERLKKCESTKEPKQEPKRGKWEIVECEPTYTLFKCSICGWDHFDITPDILYCPHCGAYMRGEHKFNDEMLERIKDTFGRELTKCCETCAYRDYLPDLPPCDTCIATHDETNIYPAYTERQSTQGDDND